LALAARSAPSVTVAEECEAHTQDDRNEEGDQHYQDGVDARCHCYERNTGVADDDDDDGDCSDYSICICSQKW
jgi:hypothetical protein